MKLEILETREFPDTYRPLADRLEGKSIFFSSFWFNNLITHVIPFTDNVLWFGIKSASDEPLLLLPLVQSPPRLFSCNKLGGLANFYTTLFEPLQTIDDPQQLAMAIEQTIQAVCQLKWDFIDLYPLNPSSPAYHLLIKAFIKCKRHVTSYSMYGNWYLLTQEQTFADYWNSRPSHLKNTVKRKTKKLKTKQIEFRIAQHPDEVQEAVALYQKTYRTSWKRDEPYQGFIPGLAQIAAKQGWLRLGLLFIDRQIAAAQLWLSVSNTAYIYKLCQNPSFDQYSPGSLLTAHLMQHVIDIDKVTKVDFLSGDDQYKKYLMSHYGERWGLQITNPLTVCGFLKMMKNELSRILKSPRSIRNFMEKVP